MKARILILLILLCSTSYFIKAQKLFVTYDLVMRTSDYHDTVGRLYFIIDSNQAYKINGETFYDFVFSSDTSEKTGYISFNKDSLAFKFIWIKEFDSIFSIKSNIQIFSFRKKGAQNMRHWGAVGPNENLIVSFSGDEYEVGVTGVTPLASHKKYITKMVFGENLYPETLFFKMAGKTSLINKSHGYVRRIPNVKRDVPIILDIPNDR